MTDETDEELQEDDEPDFSLPHECDWPVDEGGDDVCGATPTAYVGGLCYTCEEHYRVFREWQRLPGGADDGTTGDVLTASARRVKFEYDGDGGGRSGGGARPWTNPDVEGKDPLTGDGWSGALSVDVRECDGRPSVLGAVASRLTPDGGVEEVPLAPDERVGPGSGGAYASVRGERFTMAGAFSEDGAEGVLFVEDEKSTVASVLNDGPPALSWFWRPVEDGLAPYGGEQ